MTDEMEARPDARDRGSAFDWAAVSESGEKLAKAGTSVRVSPSNCLAQRTPPEDPQVQLR